jgi:hypothetical protein
METVKKELSANPQTPYNRQLQWCVWFRYPWIALHQLGDRIIHYRSEPQIQLQPGGSNWSG